MFEIGSALIKAAADIYTTHKTNKANAEAVARQNAYNTPAAQMKRLEEACLNPNLIYSSGNVVGNQANAASYDYSGYSKGVGDALNTYLAVENHDMDMQMKAEQVLNQQIANKWLDVSNAMQVMKTATEDRILKADLLTKQYSNDILAHDWNVIKKGQNTTSKDNAFYRVIGLLGQKLRDGYENSFTKSLIDRFF